MRMLLPVVADWLAGSSAPVCALAGAAGRPGCGGICYQSCPYYCNVDDDLSYNGDECCKDGRKNCVSSRGKEYATLGASASDGSPGAAGAIASAGVAGKEGEVGFSPGKLTARNHDPFPDWLT